jgi:hypothetical protein
MIRTANAPDLRLDTGVDGLDPGIREVVDQPLPFLAIG